MHPHLTRARTYSLWLSRQLDHQRLNLPLLEGWLERPLSADDFHAFADWDGLCRPECEEELSGSLRRLRRHVVAHIMTRDLCRLSDLNEVTRTITALADFAVNTALTAAHRRYAALYGEPIGRDSRQVQQLSVIVMGKAGGFELNVSSDLDLIFTYPENGDTDGKRSRSNQEFFNKVGQKLIALLDDITAEGQVFRIDMRLRPDGDSGALVCSETALEHYLITQGREWERYAWCKARVATPHANGIAALVRPFVFRKYLDYRAYEAMRGLHGQIRREVSKRGMEHNIKLGAGGIREIEFVAQIFQMIRGGQNRALQSKSTQQTLQTLAQHNILPPDTADSLLAAYRFLRDVEHRLQYWDDRQTQTLPESPEQQQLLAESMGFADYAAFSGSLNAHRNRVSAVFEGILGDPEPEAAAPSHPLTDIWLEPSESAERLNALGLDGRRFAERLHLLKHGSRYRRLSAHAQPRFDAVVPRCIEAAAASSAPDTVLPRLLDLLESVSRRSAYLVFLQQYPAALKQLAELMAQSAWLADYLIRHPIVLDELLSAQLMERADWPALSAELAGSLNACGDTEAEMDVLRRFRHAQTFRLAVQDLAGLWTVEALSDELSLLADTVIRHALTRVWQHLPDNGRDQPEFAVIGYGKLGGKELGYTSDLDLVYLYDDGRSDAADRCAKLARRLNTWLSGSTGAGTLYDVDLRLRPNGESGFLVHSLNAFAKYQHESAWTWEHQALTRARFVCGSEAVGAQFEQLRRQILSAPRDAAALKDDITAMRVKIAATYQPADSDIKHAHGGIVDVEFIVQYLVLAHSRDCPELLDNHGNIALLDKAAARGLIAAATAAAASRAYRRFRLQQHRAHLHDGAEHADLSGDYAAVRVLWCEVFGRDWQ